MLLSEAIRKGYLFKCPCGCGQPRTFLECLLECDALLMTDAFIADWVADQEKRLGVVEPTGAKGGDVE